MSIPPSPTSDDPTREDEESRMFLHEKNYLIRSLLETFNILGYHHYISYHLSRMMLECLKAGVVQGVHCMYVH